ncbi:Cof-type HAD-IIB family hydrolase [Kitasatospora putterlickiae]|uniref:Cof-type HAD-IIB family hydrolase n=1 Tax=Kitasatospora putterlickiae TaxID=221725 RepID=A0ABN1XT72_9ACTN
MIISSARTTVLDIDGTLRYDGRTIDRRILAAVEACERAGQRLVFASARPVRDLLPVLDGAFPAATLIGGNGSLVSDDGRVRARAAFEPDDLGELLVAAGLYRAGHLADGPCDYACTGPADRPILGRVDEGRLARRVDLADLPAVVTFLVADATDLAALAEAGRVLGMTVNHHLGEPTVDFAPGATDMWEALTSLGIEEYNAFGDDINDLDLPRHARHAVRGGAHPGLDGVAGVTVAADPGTVAEEVSRPAAATPAA